MFDRMFSLKSLYRDVNPTYLSGAVDVIVVETDLLTSTPFYAKFGKKKVLKIYKQKVHLYVNDQKINVSLGLSSFGDVYFEKEDCESSDEICDKSVNQEGDCELFDNRVFELNLDVCDEKWIQYMRNKEKGVLKSQKKKCDDNDHEKSFRDRCESLNVNNNCENKSKVFNLVSVTGKDCDLKEDSLLNIPELQTQKLGVKNTNDDEKLSERILHDHNFEIIESKIKNDHKKNKDGQNIVDIRNGRAKTVVLHDLNSKNDINVEKSDAQDFLLSKKDVSNTKLHPQAQNDGQAVCEKVHKNLQRIENPNVNYEAAISMPPDNFEKLFTHNTGSNVKKILKINGESIDETNTDISQKTETHQDERKNICKGDHTIVFHSSKIKDSGDKDEIMHTINASQNILQNPIKRSGKIHETPQFSLENSFDELIISKRHVTNYQNSENNPYLDIECEVAVKEYEKGLKHNDNSKGMVIGTVNTSNIRSSCFTEKEALRQDCVLDKTIVNSHKKDLKVLEIPEMEVIPSDMIPRTQCHIQKAHKNCQNIANIPEINSESYNNDSEMHHNVDSPTIPSSNNNFNSLPCSSKIISQCEVQSNVNFTPDISEKGKNNDEIHRSFEETTVHICTQLLANSSQNLPLNFHKDGKDFEKHTNNIENECKKFIEHACLNDAKSFNEHQFCKKTYWLCDIYIQITNPDAQKFFETFIPAFVIINQQFFLDITNNTKNMNFESYNNDADSQKLLEQKDQEAIDPNNKNSCVLNEEETPEYESYHYEVLESEPSEHNRSDRNPNDNLYDQRSHPGSSLILDNDGKSDERTHKSNDLPNDLDSCHKYLNSSANDFSHTKLKGLRIIKHANFCLKLNNTASVIYTIERLKNNTYRVSSSKIDFVLPDSVLHLEYCDCVSFKNVDDKFSFRNIQETVVPMITDQSIIRFINNSALLITNFSNRIPKTPNELLDRYYGSKRKFMVKATSPDIINNAHFLFKTNGKIFPKNEYSDNYEIEVLFSSENNILSGSARKDFDLLTEHKSDSLEDLTILKRVEKKPLEDIRFRFCVFNHNTHKNVMNNDLDFTLHNNSLPNDNYVCVSHCDNDSGSSKEQSYCHKNSIEEQKLNYFTSNLHENSVLKNSFYHKSADIGQKIRDIPSIGTFNHKNKHSVKEESVAAFVSIASSENSINQYKADIQQKVNSECIKEHYNTIPNDIVNDFVKKLSVKDADNNKMIIFDDYKTPQVSNEQKIEMVAENSNSACLNPDLTHFIPDLTNRRFWVSKTIKTGNIEYDMLFFHSNIESKTFAFEMGIADLDGLNYKCATFKYLKEWPCHLKIFSWDNNKILLGIDHEHVNIVQEVIQDQQKTRNEIHVQENITTEPNLIATHDVISETTKQQALIVKKVTNTDFTNPCIKNDDSTSLGENKVQGTRKNVNVGDNINNKALLPDETEFLEELHSSSDDSVILVQDKCVDLVEKNSHHVQSSLLTKFYHPNDVEILRKINIKRRKTAFLFPINIYQSLAVRYPTFAKMLYSNEHLLYTIKNYKQLFMVVTGLIFPVSQKYKKLLTSKCSPDNREPFKINYNDASDNSKDYKNMHKLQSNCSTTSQTSLYSAESVGKSLKIIDTALLTRKKQIFKSNDSRDMSNGSEKNGHDEFLRNFREIPKDSFHLPKFLYSIDNFKYETSTSHSETNFSDIKNFQITNGNELQKCRIMSGCIDSKIVFSSCGYEKITGSTYLHIFTQNETDDVEDRDNCIVLLRSCKSCGFKFFLPYNFFTDIFFYLRSLHFSPCLSKKYRFFEYLVQKGSILSNNTLPRKNIATKRFYPSHSQLARMNLQEINTAKFILEKTNQSIKMQIYKFDRNAKIIISDVDGTITKSDTWGHVYGFMGKDYSHAGVAELYTRIAQNGYKFIYLSSRPIGQADLTKNYLLNIKQNNKKLPPGPILLSPDTFFGALYREVIAKRPEVFKISCLQLVADLFDSNPFYSGFGNRQTDIFSYKTLGIPENRIFTINHTGKIVLEGCKTLSSDYATLHDLVDLLYPSIIHDCEKVERKKWW